MDNFQPMGSHRQGLSIGAAQLAVCQASDERLHAGHRRRSQRLGLDPELPASPSAMRRMRMAKGWRDGRMEESPKIQP